jgi:hypothetical protein
MRVVTKLDSCTLCWCAVKRMCNRWTYLPSTKCSKAVFWHAHQYTLGKPLRWWKTQVVSFMDKITLRSLLVRASYCLHL